MLFYKKQLELGYAGLALLRSRLFDESKKIHEILDEIVVLAKQGATSSDSDVRVKKYNVSTGYKAWADNYDHMPNLLIEVEEPIVSTMLKTIRPGKALDAACGTGRYSKILSSLGHEVTGLDSSGEMLKHAKKKVTVGNFIQGSIEKLPFEDNNFDLAIVALALTHFLPLLLYGLIPYFFITLATLFLLIWRCGPSLLGP